ncbi:MAG: tetratricopeptide repeat protein [Pseudomonadota bacterium]|nr:tetratricopeptide repeat protein [Pseudomonadota bacterium]
MKSFVVTFVIVTLFSGAQVLGNQNVLDNLRIDPNDETGNEVRALKTEILVKQTEQKAMAELTKLLKKYRGTQMEAELLFRQAELYMRQAKTDRFFELQKTNDKMKRLAPRLVEKASEKNAVTKAIAIYDSIEGRFRNFRSLDLVLFNNGFANQSIKNFSKAKALYTRLLDRYPDSFVLPDAYLSMGEMFFQEKNFSKALQFFLKIKKFPEARAYPYGLYKIAWTHYNLNDATSGLKELGSLVNFGRSVKEKGLDSRLDLRKEALEDMALFFEDVFPASHAYDFFKTPAQDFGVGAVLMRLTELYKSHSRNKDAVVVLHDLVERSPRSSYLPVAYNELAWIFETLHDRKSSVVELSKFHDICKEGSRWQKSQRGNELEDEFKGFSVSAELNCQELFDDTSLRLASKWHRMWKKQPQFIDIAQSAEAAYRLYLELPRDTKEVSQARFNFAELLFQNKKYREASENYAQVGQSEKDLSLRHDAGYAALVSLEKAVGEKWQAEDIVTFVRLASSYFKGNPQGKFLLEVKFKLGFLSYEAKDFVKAKEVFKVVGSQDKNRDLASKSQDLMMDILNKEKSYTELKNYAKNLKGSGGNKERNQKLTKIYEESFFAEIQGIEDKQDYPKAIAEYLSFSKDNPTSLLTSKAWWNAIQLYYRIERYLEAAQEGRRFAIAYPEDNGNLEILLKSAQSFEKIGRSTDAAQVLIQLAKRDTKQTKKWELLAADLFSVSPNKDEARKLYQKYAKLPNGSVDANILAKWQLLEENINDKESLKKVYQLVFAAGIQPQMSVIQIKELDLLMASKMYKEAFDLAKRILGNSESTNYAKAKARFCQGRILEDEFDNQSLKSKIERIAIVLSLKTQRLEKVQSAYESSMKYGVGEISVKAMKRLGSSYLNYSRALRNIDLPLDPTQAADVEVLRGELEKLAAPMEQKGFGILMEALALAHKFEGGGEYISEIESAINQNQTKKWVPKFKVIIEQPEIMVPKVKAVST